MASPSPWEYCFHVEQLRMFDCLSERHPWVVPRFVTLGNAKGEILGQDVIHREGALQPKDFKKWLSDIPAGATIGCTEDVEAAVRGTYGSNCEVVVLTSKQINRALSRFVKALPGYLAQLIEPCSFCEGRGLLHPGRGWGSLPCICQGISTISGITDPMIRAFYQAAQDFWMAKPWMRLRVNHVLRLQVPDSPFEFVQVLGGAGSCEVAVLAFEDWESCQSEKTVGDNFMPHDGSWLSVVKVELDPVPSNGRRSWVDLDYIEEQRRNDAPLPLPDPSNPDHLTQPALPSIHRHFLRSKPPREPGGARTPEQHMTLPTAAEFAYLTAAMHAIAALVRDGAFRDAPGSGAGDHARYYSFKREMELPEGAGGGTANLQYPGITDASRMTPLQRFAFDKAEAPPEQPVAAPALSIDVLSARHEIMRIKRSGNERYDMQDYEGAIEKYGEAISELAALLREAGGAGDPQFLYDLVNLYSNRAQAATKLGRWQQVLKDCRFVLEGPHAMQLGPWQKYVPRCCENRRKALAALAGEGAEVEDEGEDPRVGIFDAMLHDTWDTL